MELSNLPKHIAIIMDGNGTWATKRNLPRTKGHEKGCEALVEVCKNCNKLGIKYLTVFAFSTENWARPTEEVNYLMSLPKKMLNRYEKDLMKDNIKFSVIGFRDGLDLDTVEIIERLEEKTKNNSGLNLIVAFNYGSQDEIINAVKLISEDVSKGLVNISDIDKKYFESKLFTKDIPQVDLLIRTSNQIRISNFLLWQISYSELYFTNTLWPDFGYDDLIEALNAYQMRDRKYGGIKK